MTQTFYKAELPTWLLAELMRKQGARQARAHIRDSFFAVTVAPLL